MRHFEVEFEDSFGIFCSDGKVIWVDEIKGVSCCGVIVGKANICILSVRSVFVKNKCAWNWSLHKKQQDIAVKKAPVVVKDCPCPIVAKWAVFTGKFEFVWDVNVMMGVEPAEQFHADFEVVFY